MRTNTQIGVWLTAQASERGYSGMYRLCWILAEWVSQSEMGTEETYESDNSITLQRDDERCPFNNLSFSGLSIA